MFPLYKSSSQNPYPNFAFTGASGVGKSTLLSWIDAIYPKFIIKELSGRDFLPKDKSYVDAASDKSNVLIAYNRSINFFNDLTDLNNTYVYSRSTICNIAYCESLNKAKFLIPLLEKELELLGGRTHYLYIPIEFEMDPTDLVRGVDKDTQKRTDEAIYNVIQKSNVTWDLITGSIEDRCKQLTKIFSSYAK